MILLKREWIHHPSGKSINLQLICSPPFPCLITQKNVLHIYKDLHSTNSKSIMYNPLQMNTYLATEEGTMDFLRHLTLIISFNSFLGHHCP